MEMSHFKVGEVLHTAWRVFSEGYQPNNRLSNVGGLLVGVFFVDVVLSDKYELVGEKGFGRSGPCSGTGTAGGPF